MSMDELVAKALYDAEIDFSANAEVWPFETEPVRKRLLGEAAGIINMLDAAGLVIVPKEATPAMVAAAAPDVSFAEHADYEIALKAVELLPSTQHPEVADVLASMVKDYRIMIKAASG